MKRWFYYLRQILPGLLFVCVLCSCSKSEEWIHHSKKATLILNIPMLQSQTRGTVEGTSEENAIYNLRVVILSQGAESINQTFKQTDLTSGTVTIENVPVGLVQMYVIANEAALGKDYSDLTVLRDEAITVDGKRKVLIKDEGRMHFPKRGSEFAAENSNPETTKGLPMSWMKQFTVNPPAEESQKVNVELQRCVAKLKIIMQSTLSENITISEMNFGAFFGDRLFLFQEPERNLDVPNDALYTHKDYTGLDITIPANGEKILECYIYPSFAWRTDLDVQSPYTIGFKTDKNEYDPQSFIYDGSPLNSIARNTQVNITAKLSKPANINISFEVVPWTVETVDIPSFN